MHINEINVTKFQGLHHAALEVSEPILLVSGGNGAGKSSLLDAIAMAFTGHPRRVNLKKDMAQLVTEGSKKGSVSLSTSEGVFSTTLPTAKSPVHLVDQPFLPFVLDASKFASIDGKERRKLLFELTGASANPREVAKRLADRGVNPDLIERVKPLLLSGFPAAADQAKSFASEARGAWQQITGERYGSDKADGWEPEMPPVDVSEDELTEARRALEQLQQDMNEATETLGAHKSAAQQAEQVAGRIKDLQELAELKQRRADKLSRDQADLAHWQKQLAEAQEATAGGKQGLIHDLARALTLFEEVIEKSDGHTSEGKPMTPWFTTQAADAMVSVMERYRAEHGSPDAVAEPGLIQRLPEFQKIVESLIRTVANSERDLKQSTDAEASLAELKQSVPEVPPADAIENAEQLISELRRQRDALQAKVGALEDALAVVHGRDQSISEAATQHQKVEAWSAIAEALSPTGIPAEILAAALSPVNDLLRELSAVAGWKEARINGDIEITYGERLYGLLSESEKWRVDALLAVTIAKLSGLAFVTLDRFDVLEPAARPQALKLLMNGTRTGILDQAVMAGTMKEPMAKVPAGIQAVWIADGVLTDQEAKAA